MAAVPEQGRAALQAADDALAAGDNAACVRKSVEAYELLVAARPEMVARPPQRSRRDGPLIPDMPRIMAVAPWPSTMGVRLAFEGDDEHPVLTFEKERFTMGEAVAYYEYTRDLYRVAAKD